MDDRHETGWYKIVSCQIGLVIRTECKHGTVVWSPVDNRAVIYRSCPLHVDEHIGGHAQDTCYAHVTMVTAFEVNLIMEEHVLQDKRSVTAWQG